MKINYINVTKNVIKVGATTNDKWNSQTLVWALLERDTNDGVCNETIELYPLPSSAQERLLAINVIPALLENSRKILDHEWDQKTAIEQLYGKIITNN